MGRSLSGKIIAEHLVDGRIERGEEIDLLGSIRVRWLAREQGGAYGEVWTMEMLGDAGGERPSRGGSSTLLGEGLS